MKSPAFQFYPEKWQADTRRLTWEAKGVYHELICVIWLQFQETCTIPDDDRFIAAEMGCNLDIWKKCKAELQDPKRPILETLRDGSLLVRGLLKEKEKQKHFKELAVRGGNASSRLRKGDSKWGKEMSVKKLQQRTEQRTEPLGKPNEPPTNSLSLSLSPTVEEIYYAYPLKVGKPAALKAIRRALESINPETLLSLTKKYAEHRNGDLTYIPHPSTWFNRRDITTIRERGRRKSPKPEN